MRVEDWLKCECENVEPASESSILERGEDALPAINGLLCKNKDVSVAAAFISISPSTSISSERCFSFPLSVDEVFFRLLLGETTGFAFFGLTFGGRDGSFRGDDLVTRDFGDRSGAGMGGSFGLWIVRACFVEGSANIDANRFGA